MIRNAIFLIMIICVFPATCRSEEESFQSALTEGKVDKAVQNAIDYLLSQQKSDGSIYDVKNQVAMTALSILALCSAGHMPADSGREGEAVRKALEYILHGSFQEENGYYGNRDGSRMYGHGIVSLMLAELLGMGVDEKQDKIIRDRLEKAIQLILWAEEQKKEESMHYGGWRYAPNAADSDLSVTIWQLMTLRASRNAGLDIPKISIDNAIEYVKRTYNRKSATEKVKETRKITGSACAYQPGNKPSYASASAGLLALQVCGEYECPEVEGSADYLLDYELNYNDSHFFYGTYYYAQGMYQRGGKYADHAKNSVETILLEKQGKDGSWEAGSEKEKSVGKVYATAMATLSLSVYYHYLPIYQR